LISRIENLLLIREGERSNVAYFLLFFLLVSAGMAVGRGTADALFLKRLGIEYLPVMYMVQSLLLAGRQYHLRGLCGSYSCREILPPAVHNPGNHRARLLAADLERHQRPDLSGLLPGL